ncbi:MAG: hypothetical protein PF574_04800 [Candidatus Delongbacteria bacterium]|jgi:transcriptional regulator with PAS, ATPase and Fis domain|nr:hypothetical protein [Candidatus Delongbacteria bacterium]
MNEFITLQVEQELLIKVLQKAKEKRGNVSELIRQFFKWIVQTDSSLDFISFSNRQPEQSLDDYLKEIEKSEIQKVCDEAKSKQEAAEKLGITYRSFRYRLDQHGMDFNDKDL